MTNFLDKFPKIPYNISGTKPANYNLVTNIFFRFSFLRDIINNASAYEEYTIRDGDTPEIVAHKYYGDSEAYWLILYANDIYDPQYDWPLTQQNFNNYIETKYGSVANSQAQMHHYEKVVGRQVENSDEFLFNTYEIDYAPATIMILKVSSYTGAQDPGDIVYQSADYTYANASFTAEIVSFSGANDHMFLTNTIGNYVTTSPTYNYTKGGPVAANTAAYGFTTEQILYPDMTIPHDYYVNISAEPYTETYTVNGKMVTEVTGRRAVTCYDHETELNEKKRHIKLISKAYYGQIMNEFAVMTNSIPTYMRRLKG